MNPLCHLFLSGSALLAAHGHAAQAVIEAPGPAGKLQGMLTTASGPASAVVLIIPGSGPTDRDGNSPLGLQTNAYKLLAEELARQGIASVRIDKRGMFGSAAAVPDPNAVTIDDYAQDVHSWLPVLREKTGTSCVWLLGHSEGGLVAIAAARKPANICGLLLVAAPGRPLGTILREQLAANPANKSVLPAAQAILQRLEAGQQVAASEIDPALLPLFHPAVQGFLISELKLDPARLLASQKRPVLILQGKRDLQVSVQDAERLKSARPDATLELLPEMNHVLKPVKSDDRNANLATYADPQLPLAELLVSRIADFIKAHP